MEAKAAVELLKSLGVNNAQNEVLSLQDGTTHHIQTASGATLALLRRGSMYDSLLVGSETNGPVFPLRKVLEDAFLPLSEDYAAKVGVSTSHRDTIRKGIREVAVALDVISSGRVVSVHPPDFPRHLRLQQYIDEGRTSINSLPESFVDDLAILNELQANVVSWGKEIDRIVDMSRTGPGTVLSAEEETVFWSSLDVALSAAETFISSPLAKVSLDILARKRRAKGFLIETSVTIASARRNSAAVLGLVQGLPLVALRSAEDLTSLKDAVIKLLEHIASKVRGSAFSVDRSLSLIHAMGDDVTHSVARILSTFGDLLSISFSKFSRISEQCCELFEAWSHGFDICRQVIRKVARMRGESVPQRVRTQISRLYSHLIEVYNLRADHQSLYELLIELTEPGHSSRYLEMLDSAYSCLRDASKNFNHFEINDIEESVWFEASSTYRSSVKEVEDSVCLDYSDLIERSTNLSSLARSVVPFTSVVDKHFMSSCVEEALPFVLQLANQELSMLLSREYIMNSRDVKQVIDGIPIICTVLLESIQICERASTITKNVEGVVGNARMSMTPELNDFAGGVQVLIGRLQPTHRFLSWLDNVVSLSVQKPLFCIEKLSSGRMHLSVGLDTRVAYFFMVYSLKSKFANAPLSRSHLERSIFSRTILPVFTDLQQALYCYNAVTDHLKSLDTHKLERILPFIYELLDKSETLWHEGFSLRWNSEPLQLFSYSSAALKFSSNLYHKYFYVIENDIGIETAIQSLVALRPVFEKGFLPKQFFSKIGEVFDLISAYRSALLLNLPSMVVEGYMRKSWRAKLMSIFLGLLSESLVNFFNSIIPAKLGQLQLSLFPEEKNGRTILRCVPSVASAEEFLYNCVGSVYSSFREALEYGLQQIGVSANEARTLFLDLLRSSMTLNKRSLCDDPMLSPFQRILQEVMNISSLIRQWFSFVKYLSLQSKTESRSAEKAELNQNALGSLSQLAEVYDSVMSTPDFSDLELASTFISLRTTSLRKQILSNVKEAIRDRAKICAAESATLSQALYAKISEAQELLGDISAGSILDVVVCLHEMKDDVMPFCRKALEGLLHREKLFERITNNILQSSPSLSCDTDSWILHRDLKPHLERLESLYKVFSGSALANKSALLAKYEDLRSHYQVRMAAIFADFQAVRGKDFVDETYLDMEELLQDLEHQLQQLEDDAISLERLANVLSIDSKVDRNGPSGILNELNRLRDSLKRLGEISDEMIVLGKVPLLKTDFLDLEKKLKKFQADIEETVLRTGKNHEALKLSSCLSKRLQELRLLEALRDIEISPPRERDMLKRLFNESFSKEGLKLVPLHEFWENDILSQEGYLKAVFKAAAGEAQICDFLRSVESKWSARRCIFSYQDDVPLLQGIPVFLDELEEHIQALETMKASPHAKLFETDRAAWEKRLALARERIELLTDVQSRWAHLKTLFMPRSASGSMVSIGELADEMSAFMIVNARFSSIGNIISSSPGLLEGLEGELGLEDMQEELRGIVRGLARFLEKQRVRFPRFFFLSDDDLLHVLSVSSFDIDGVQSHISKLFPGLARINFEIDESNIKIISVQSSEGEVLTFSYPVTVSDKTVVTWLHDLQDAIRCSLKEALVDVLQRVFSFYETPPVVTSTCFQHFRNSLVQVSILAIRIRFTESIDSCLQDISETWKGLQAVRGCIEQNLSSVCSLRTCPTDVDLSEPVFSMFRNHLIKEFVYQRDLVIRLLTAQFSHVRKHIWQNELRFIAKPNGTNANDVEVYIYCSCACFGYGWEYLGIGEALVRTNLTSRCTLILSEAMRRGYGGSPFGPAGTGKTETVKSFGRSLGRMVSVFNCDESFDSISVGRILAGVCRLGCWVCFDEFNRLSDSSLSSTSEQLVAIQDAIRKDEKEIPNFYGGEFRITVSLGLSVFVTMNPTYTGRRELPANLKTLFRPCAMSKPDSELIAEVLLLSENFNFSDILSKKLITFFDALKSTVSEQPHYDFGLRSLKSTIVVCGSLSRMSEASVETRTLELEEDCIVRGIDEVLKPKLDVCDLLDYECLLSSTFSLSSSAKNGLPLDLSENVQSTVKERKLSPHPTFMEKVRQLYSLLQHHYGVMMVGATGTGKSTTWRVLFEAIKQTNLDRHKVTGEGKSLRSSLTVIDAKLLSTNQLYGSMDSLTREWSDGLFTTVLRTIAEERVTATEITLPLHWIVFDGDVDPDWIETLNSVLDDNRILTLPNGEQIPFLSNTRIIFETDHLRHANPSSVSRCGMICFGDDAFSKVLLRSSVIESLIEVSPSYRVPSFIGELANVVSNFAGLLVKKGLVVMKVSIHSLHHSFLTLFRHTLRIHLSGKSVQHLNYESPSKIVASAVLTDELVVKIVLTSAMKAIGSGLSYSDRQELSNDFLAQVRDIDGVDQVLQGIVIPCLADVAILPTAEFIEYGELLGSCCHEQLQRDIGSPDIVVPTPTTVRLEHLLRGVLNLSSNPVRHSCPLILCGPPGCGKSMILTAALREIPNVSLATLSFSSETSPSHILLCLRGHTVISKRPNGTYVMHPKSAGYRVILFCDEVNLVKPDRYETQASVSFLRSMAELGGFWAGSPPYWVSIEGIQIVAACNPPDDAGRHQLSPRFLRHCFVVRVEEPVPTDLKIIYGSFVEVLLRQLNPQVMSKKDCLTSAMVEFYSCNKERFSPSSSGPSEAHYIYSPRDLSRWIRGMTILLAYLFADSSPKESFLNDQEKETIWIDIISAFCYEARRLFRDRLVCQEERNFVENKLLEIVSKFLMSRLTSVPEVLYTSWMGNDEGSEMSDRTFRVVEDSQVFRSLIYEKLRAFSEEQGLGGTWISGVGENEIVGNDVLDQFAVTDDVLTHLTRIERVLCQPLGHAVLIGSSGTGKKTLARFAAWMLSIEVHQVRSNSSYNELQFAKDLREILRRASIHNQNMLMIFDESHAMETAFLEMMNSLLACGEVPGLFSGEEKAQLLNDLRQVSSHGSSTEQFLYSEFVNRIRRNLHIIFTISTAPSSENNRSKRSSALSDLSKRSPALYNRCTCDWIGDWSRETLQAVAELKIEVARGSDLEPVSNCAVEIHEAARDFIESTRVVASVTPRHYLEFIEQFNRVTLEKGGNIETGVERYKKGLGRLRTAAEAVEDLRESLSIKAEDLRLMESHANDMLYKMMEEQRLAEKSKLDAEQLALAAEEASAAAKNREEDVAVQLSEVLPKIEAARQAVGSIRKDNLEELRGMPNPPDAVQLALEAVVMMLDGSGNRVNYPLQWNTIRSRMRSSDFIPSVVSFDGSTLSKTMRSRVQNRIMKNPLFDVDKISYASKAAGPLAQWTLAVLDFVSVQESVEPLQQEVVDLQQQQSEYIRRQEVALREALSFQKRIDECRAEYARLVSESEKIRQDISESESSLTKVERMLDSLTHEWNRWIHDMKVLGDSAGTVWGDSVFAAAFIAYAGSLDYLNRSKLSSIWKALITKHGIPFNSDMSIASYLTTPEQRGRWSTNGLPVDASSLENYAILRRSARFPLIVDPTRGCANLLKHVLKAPCNPENTSSSEELRITVSTFAATGKKSYMRALESAVRFGTVIILEDAERYDRVLTPLLGQEVFFSDNEKQSATRNEKGQSTKNGAQKFVTVCQRVVRLGDHDVFLSSNFSMFLTTSNLGKVPRAAVTRANVVSFELSAAALGATCVSRSLNILAPEVERRRVESISALVELEHRKRNLEEKVLLTINQVDDLGTNLLSGPLLEDLTLLKREVEVIDKRHKEEEIAAQEIKEKEVQFEPLGKTAVDIFAVIQSLASIDSIYRYDTEFFLSLFEAAIQRSVGRASNETPVSLRDCQETLLEHTLSQLLASLFPCDRLPFAASIILISSLGGVSHALRNESDIQPQALFSAWRRSLTRLEKSLDGQKVMSSETFISELPERLKHFLETDTNLDGRKKDIFISALSVLKNSLENPHDISASFERLACVFPECQKVIQGTNAGPEGALYSTLNSFARMRKNPKTGERIRFRPLLLCVRGETCDPAASVMDFSNDAKTSLISLAMGSTITGDTLTSAITTAGRKCDEGRRVVVLIKNMHLSNKSTVDCLQSEMAKGRGALSCLLVVVVEVSSEFSKDVILALSPYSHVLAFESPPSFRTNFSLAVEKASKYISKPAFHSCSRDEIVQGMLVMISWLHACVLERALHSPIGFAKGYDFSETDLIAALDVLQVLLHDVKEPDNGVMTALSSLLSSCVYGCRVEHDSDHDIIEALIEGLLCLKQIKNAEKLNEVSVICSETQTLTVPLSSEKLNEFMKNMPVHAMAEWCRLPSDTGIFSQTKEGADVLRKVLLLSNKNFCEREETTGNISKASETKDVDFKPIILKTNAIPHVSEVMDWDTKISPLGRFIKREREIVKGFIQSIKSDVSNLVEAKGKRETSGIKHFRGNVNKLLQDGKREVPFRWLKLSRYFGNGLNIDELLERVTECALLIQEIHPSRTVIDLRGVVRPRALITAMRYEESKKFGVAPHRLYPVVYGLENFESTKSDEYVLSGLRLTGAEWDSKAAIFKVSDMMAPLTTNQFAFQWRSTESNQSTVNDDDKHGYVPVSIYGRGQSRTLISTVNLVTFKGEKLAKWRLNGVCFSLR